MIRSPIVLLTLGALPVLFIAGPARAQEGEEAERRLGDIRHEIEDLRAADEEVPEELVQQAHALQQRLEGGERSRGHGGRRPGFRGRGGESRREGRSRFERPDDRRRSRYGRPDRAGIEGELENLRNEVERVQRHLAELREHDREVPRELGEAAERLQHRIQALERVLARPQSPEGRHGEGFERRGRGGGHAEGRGRGGGHADGRPRGDERRPGSRFGRGGPERGARRESMPNRGSGRPRGRGGPSHFGRRTGDSGDAFKLFAKIAPEEAEELQRLRREDRREFFMRMREIMPEMRRLIEMREEDPEAFEHTIHERHIEHRAMRLAQEAREAEGERREELVDQVREHLNELFEVRMRDRDTRIEQLEHELDRLRHEQEQRREQRGDLIERRLAELMGEALEF